MFKNKQWLQAIGQAIIAALTAPRRSNGNGVTLYSSNQNEREASPTREGFLIGLPNHVAI